MQMILFTNIYILGRPPSLKAVRLYYGKSGADGVTAQERVVQELQRKQELVCKWKLQTRTCASLLRGYWDISFC